MGFKIASEQKAEVNAKVVALVADGTTTAKATQQVAGEYGVTAGRVYEIYREFNPRTLDPNDPRAGILRARAEGKSLKVIAEEHNCSTNKVVQTCKIYRLAENES